MLTLVCHIELNSFLWGNNILSFIKLNEIINLSYSNRNNNQKILKIIFSRCNNLKYNSTSLKTDGKKTDMQNKMSHFSIYVFCIGRK